MAEVIDSVLMSAKIFCGLLFLIVILFLPANTIFWPEAWFYIMLQTSISYSIILWLRNNNPELLKERFSFKKPTKIWDMAIWIMFIIFFIILCVTASLDANRYHWTKVPLLIQSMGFAGIIFWGFIHFSVLKANKYAYLIVEVCINRGQKVVKEGPYHVIRHPMYIGFIIFFISLPLALGSFYALTPGILVAVAFIIRTHLEDKVLQEELPGYKTYSQEVKYRLLPGIW